MSLNMTLLGQMITFAIFIWFTMKYVWPPIMEALEERQKKIAEGLSAAEQGEQHLEYAQHKAVELVNEAKVQSAQILEQSNKRGNTIIDEAKQKAKEEGQRLLHLAKVEIEQEKEKAREQLRKEVASLALLSAQRLLEKEIDEAANAAMFDKLMAELK